MSSTSESLKPSDYQFAVYSQSACNLSGIVHSFSDIIGKVWAEARAKGKDTDWVNEHPICRLFAEQIMHLTRKRNWDEAYKICEENSKEITREI